MIVRPSTADDLPRLLEIWRAAVDATHRFLSDEHRAELDAIVGEQFLPSAGIWVAAGEDDRPVGWLVMDGQMIEALFVDPDAHGRGIGTRLIEHAATLSPTLRVEANEQASNALPFYLARGFRIVGRTERDHDGRPYPLVQLARD